MSSASNDSGANLANSASKASSPKSRPNSRRAGASSAVANDAKSPSANSSSQKPLPSPQLQSTPTRPPPSPARSPTSNSADGGSSSVSASVSSPSWAAVALSPKPPASTFSPPPLIAAATLSSNGISESGFPLQAPALSVSSHADSVKSCGASLQQFERHSVAASSLVSGASSAITPARPMPIDSMLPLASIQHATERPSMASALTQSGSLVSSNNVPQNRIFERVADPQMAEIDRLLADGGESLTLQSPRHQPSHHLQPRSSALPSRPHGTRSVQPLTSPAPSKYPSDSSSAFSAVAISATHSTRTASFTHKTSTASSVAADSAAADHHHRDVSALLVHQIEQHQRHQQQLQQQQITHLNERHQHALDQQDRVHAAAAAKFEHELAHARAELTRLAADRDSTVRRLADAAAEHSAAVTARADETAALVSKLAHTESQLAAARADASDAAVNALGATTEARVAKQAAAEAEARYNAESERLRTESREAIERVQRAADQRLRAAAAQVEAAASHARDSDAKAVAVSKSEAALRRSAEQSEEAVRSATAQVSELSRLLDCERTRAEALESAMSMHQHAVAQRAHEAATERQRHAEHLALEREMLRGERAHVLAAVREQISATLLPHLGEVADEIGSKVAQFVAKVVDGERGRRSRDQNSAMVAEHALRRSQNDEALVAHIIDALHTRIETAMVAACQRNDEASSYQLASIEATSAATKSAIVDACREALDPITSALSRQVERPEQQQQRERALIDSVSQGVCSVVDARISAMSTAAAAPMHRVEDTVARLALAVDSLVADDVDASAHFSLSSPRGIHQDASSNLHVSNSTNISSSSSSVSNVTNIVNTTRRSRAALDSSALHAVVSSALSAAWEEWGTHLHTLIADAIGDAHSRSRQAGELHHASMVEEIVALREHVSESHDALCELVSETNQAAMAAVPPLSSSWAPNVSIAEASTEISAAVSHALAGRFASMATEIGAQCRAGVEAAVRSAVAAAVAESSANANSESAVALAAAREQARSIECQLEQGRSAEYGAVFSWWTLRQWHTASAALNAALASEAQAASAAALVPNAFALRGMRDEFDDGDEYEVDEEMDADAPVMGVEAESFSSPQTRASSVSTSSASPALLSPISASSTDFSWRQSVDRERSRLATARAELTAAAALATARVTEVAQSVGALHSRFAQLASSSSSGATLPGLHALMGQFPTAMLAEFGSLLGGSADVNISTPLRAPDAVSASASATALSWAHLMQHIVAQTVDMHRCAASLDAHATHRAQLIALRKRQRRRWVEARRALREQQLQEQKRFVTPSQPDKQGLHAVLESDSAVVAGESDGRVSFRSTKLTTSGSLPNRGEGESDGESYLQTCFHSSIVAATFGIVVLIVAVLLKEVPMFRFLPPT